MTRRLVAILLLSVLFLGATAWTGAAQDGERFIRGEPGLDVYAPEPTVTAGSTTELTLQVANEGELQNGPVAQRDLVTTARNVRVDVDDTDPITVETNRQSIGPVPGGDVRTAPVTIEVPDDAEPGTYRLDVELGYSHTSLSAPGSNVVQERTRTVTRSIRVTVEAKPRLELSVRDSSLQVGETGVIEGTLENVGRIDVEDVTLALGEGRFEPWSSTYTIGALDANESADFQFRGTVPSMIDAVTQRIEITTGYRTAGGADGSTTDPIRLDVEDRREAVGISAVESRFTAGEDGTLELDVTNELDVPVRDVQLQLGVEAPLTSEFRRTALPSLQPGETDSVVFDLEVDDDAPANRYPATIEAEYTDSDDDRVTSRPSTVAITVTEEDSEEFPIEYVIFGVLVVFVAAGAWWVYGR